MTLGAKMHFSKNVFGYFCMLRFSSKGDKNKEDLFCCFGGNRQREKGGGCQAWVVALELK
jgi:hypothetical protein